MKQINVAIIGYGMAGELFHLPPLLSNPNYKVMMVMTQHPIRISKLKKIDPSIQIISSFDQAIHNEHIDLIVIATSNDVHEVYTKKALMHHKHVVCEKPFVETYNQAKVLFDLAQKNNLILSVYHNRAYDGDILKIKSMIKDQIFGDIISFSARFDRYIPVLNDNWRYKTTKMAGIYYDLAPHLVHHAISIFGKPKQVFLSLFYDHEHIEVDDHFEMILYYQDFTCFLGAQTYERHQKPRFEIIGSKKTYIKYGFDQPDVNYDASLTHILEPIENSILILDDKKKLVPIEIGKHYLYYEKLANQINQNIRVNDEALLQLEVISIMEKGLESHIKKVVINCNES